MDDRTLPEVSDVRTALLDAFIESAGRSMASTAAAACLLADGAAFPSILRTVNLDAGALAARAGDRTGLPARLVDEMHPVRLHGKALPADLLPRGSARASLLGLAIRHEREALGWALFVREGAPRFTREDERVAAALCAGFAALAVAAAANAPPVPAQGDLAMSRELLGGVIASAMDAIICIDEEQRIVIFNAAAERLFGYTAAEMLGRPLDVLIPERFRNGHRAQVRTFGESGVTVRRIGALGTITGLHRDGSEILLEAAVSRAGPPGRRLYTVILRDVTEARRAEEAIRRLNRVYAVLSGINSLIVRATSREELFHESCRIAVEEAGFRLAWIGAVDRRAGRLRLVASYGGDPDYLVHMPLGLHSGDADTFGTPGRAVATLEPQIVNDIAREGGFKPARRGEALRHGFRSVVFLPIPLAGRAFGVMALYADVVNFFDAAEIKLLRELADDIGFALEFLETSDRLRYLSSYDPLTGLPNRTLLVERIEERLGKIAGDGETATVTIIDLDSLKGVNDAFGRAGGDALLKQMAERLARLARDPACLGRVDADEFAMFGRGLKDERQIRHATDEQLREITGTPFHIAGKALRIAARAGVAVWPRDGTDAETLLRNAEAALRQAKQRVEPYLLFDHDMSRQEAERLTLHDRLLQACERQEFELYYQCKVDVDSRRITGLEALIRWNAPGQGVIPPMTFIPVLEETGLILEVGTWVLRQAVADRKTLLDLFPGNAPRIAVNVSARQLRRPDFVDVVREALGGKDSGIDLEITESMIMEDFVANVEKLRAVRELGVEIAIDDFGTGYSSLAYLTRMPADALKVDRSFISTMLKEPDAMTLVTTIISLARSLRLRVVAEGVDSEDQANMLRLLRCDAMQGYLFGKPMPLGEMIARLQAEPAGPGTPP